MTTPPDKLTAVGNPSILTWSSEIGLIAAAYSAAQSKMDGLAAAHNVHIPGRDGKRDIDYNYANLPDALKACIGAFNAEGCPVIQPVTFCRGGVNVSTFIPHTSGQWVLAAPLFMPVNGNAQAVGSAITYGRRYQLLGMVGLAPDDDDGKLADDNGSDFEACHPDTAAAIGTLCGQIAQHVGRDDVDRLTVLRTALTKTGHQYNAEIMGAKNLSRAEALLVQPWLINDLKTYGNEGDQSEPPYPEGMNRGES